ADQVNAVYAGALPSADSVRSTSSRTLDQRGLPTAVTDPNGNVTSYAYDEAGRQTVATLPTVSTETSGGTAVAAHPVSMVGYDTFGATVEASDADGNVTTTARDADGRPTSMTAPSYTPPGSSSPITPVSTRTYNN